jgi:2-methylcitrate dehydratase
MDVFGPDWDISRLTGDLGKSFRILNCGMKAFPTEALTHTHLSAVLDVVKSHNVSYDQIAEVEVTSIARACDILFDPHKYRPESRETADHSLPYCIACALVDHEVTTRSFSKEKMADKRIWAVIDKIKGKASEEFEKMFPAKQPSRVIITTTDGKKYESYLEYPKGDPREPMSDEDLMVKFNSLSAGLLTENQQAQVHDAVFNRKKLTCRQFMNELVVRR